MHHISFGNVLKEARLAKGMDLATVSRELRIRQDIVVAIESSDFARMPSRGYTRNMVIAYARLVGLNAHDVSRMYLDQEYAYQVEQAHRSVGTAVRMHDVEGDRASSRSRSHSNREEPQEVYDGSTNFLGRRLYSQDPDIPRPVSSGPSNPTRGMSHAGGTAHRARRSAMPEGKYTNLYQAPRNMPDLNVDATRSSPSHSPSSSSSRSSSASLLSPSKRTSGEYSRDRSDRNGSRNTSKRGCANPASAEDRDD